MRVLVVDDDPMQLELVERALSRDGFEIRTASDLGQLAQAAKQHAPDIVLIDVNMPDVTGEQVIAVARDAAPRAKLILYSAWEESRLRSLANKLGADGYLSKSESVIAIGKRLRDVKGTS